MRGWGRVRMAGRHSLIKKKIVLIRDTTIMTGYVGSATTTVTGATTNTTAMFSRLGASLFMNGLIIIVLGVERG
jgi:hypothetical protein